MKILVLGASSFVGFPLVEELIKESIKNDLDYQVIGSYYHNRPDLNCELLKIDITIKEELLSLLSNINPDIIVNCVALSNVDRCELNPNFCRKVNVLPTEIIIEYCKNKKSAENKIIKYIFLSSSQVFSGEEIHDENSSCSPLNYYGQCKLKCEKLIKTMDDYAIIRSCLIYGKKEGFQHQNLVNLIIEQLSAGNIFTAYANQVRSPVFVEDVARMITEIIKQNQKGIFHCGGGKISVYDFALEVAKAFDLDYNLIKPTTSSERTLEYKPKNTALDCAKTADKLNLEFHTLYKSLVKIKQQMESAENMENHTENEDLTSNIPECQKCEDQKIVLVTGGAGFIGSHLVEALAQKGFKVRVLDSLVKGKLSSIKYLIDQGKVEFIEGDIRNRDIVDKAVEGVDYVFHTAGIHIQKSAESPEDCINVNIQGSYNVFLSALKHNVKRVIFSSSSSIYGDPKKLPMHEDDQPYPAEPYGAAKLFCESLLHHLSKQGLKYNALRYFNVYGERQAAHAYYTTVVTHFIKRIMNNEPPTIDGKGDQSMDFTHVSDVVQANIQAMESEAVNEVFNVGTGVSTSVAQLADIIIKSLGKDIQPIFREREVLVTRRQADTSKAEQLLRFKAQVNVNEGLSQVAKEIAGNPEKY